MVVLALYQTGFSQDPAYSQFYGNPLYLNPALAGTGECMRLTANYRNQWPSLPGGFVQYSGSIDFYSEPLHGGIGLLVSSDNIAQSTFVTNRAALIYAYRLRINMKTELHAGFQGGVQQQTFNWDDLVFADMIDQSTGTITGSTGETGPANTTVWAPDFSAGFVAGYDEKVYAGMAVHHMTQPGLDYFGNGEGNPLYAKYTFHAGANIVLYERSIGHSFSSWTLSPNLLYQQQRNFRQLNGGFYLSRSPLVGGVWYRYNFENSDALILLLGIKQKRFTFGYSYDLSVSSLKGASGGAHEVALSLLIHCEKRGRPGAIKCPEF